MPQKAMENKRKTREGKLVYILQANVTMALSISGKEKNDGLKSGVKERREKSVEKKRKEQEGVGHYNCFSAAKLVFLKSTRCLDHFLQG